METLEFSDKQREVLHHAVDPHHTSIICSGSVRSGKSLSCWMSFCLYVLALEEKYHHAIVGQSIESILRSIGYDLIDFIGTLPGCSAKEDRSVGTRIVVQGMTKQIIWLVGGDSSVGKRRLQGATLAGLLLEEMTVLNKSLFYMAFSRLSLPISKMWGNCNPASPTHYVLTDVIRKIKNFDGRVIKFTLDDNPSLDEKIKKRFQNAYSGVFYDRYIKGLWAQSEDLIWPHFTVVGDETLKGYRWVCGFDWACSGTVACLAIKIKGKNGIVAHEFFRDGRKEGILNEAQVCDLVACWFEKIAPARGTYFYIDPSTPASTRANFRKKGYIVRSADNAIKPGIITVGNLLARGRVKIHERCIRLRKELESYVYDEKKADSGLDVVWQRNQDHGCDSLRYALHSLFKRDRQSRPILVTEALAS